MKSTLIHGPTNHGSSCDISAGADRFESCFFDLSAGPPINAWRFVPLECARYIVYWCRIL